MISWITVDRSSNDRCPHDKLKSRKQPHRYRGGGHVKTEAESRGMGLQAERHQGVLGASRSCETGMEQFSPELPEGPTSADSLISDFWPSELWENTFLWLEATKFEVFAGGRPRKRNLLLSVALSGLTSAAGGHPECSHSLPRLAHIWRQGVWGTCLLDSSDRQHSLQSCLLGSLHQSPLIQACFLLLLCTCMDPEKTTLSPRSVSASASRELNLRCKRNAPLWPFSGLTTVHCLRCYHSPDDHQTVWNIDVDVAITRKFLVPFLVYVNQFSQFLYLSTPNTGTGLVRNPAFSSVIFTHAYVN